MSSRMIDILDKILSLLETCKNDGDQAKNMRIVILSIGDLCQELSRGQEEAVTGSAPTDALEVVSPADFSQWLKSMHDFLLLRDAGLRSVLLRATRLSLPGPARTSSLGVEPSPPCDLCALLVTHHIHLVAINSLEKEHNSNWERMQALKLMKRVLEASPSTFPLAFARSLVAVAQHSAEPGPSSGIAPCKQSPDSCKNICVEMLRELALVNVEVAYQAGALKVIFDIILSETSQDLVEPLLMTVLFLLNKPHTRRFIRPYLDLQWLLSPFTDLESQPAAVVKGSGAGAGGREELNAAAKKLQAAKFAFVSLMKSWGGIVALTASDTGLLALVRLLADSKVSDVVKETILDCISEICEPVITKLEFNKTNSVKNVSISNPTTASTPSSSSTALSVTPKRGRAGSGEDGRDLLRDNAGGEEGGGRQERAGSAGGRLSRSGRSGTNPEAMSGGGSRTHSPSPARYTAESLKTHRRSSLQISNIVNHERQARGDELDPLDGGLVLEGSASASASSVGKRSSGGGEGAERALSGRWTQVRQGGSGNGGGDVQRDRKESVSKPLSVWTRFTSHAELAEKFSVDPIYNMLDNYAGVLCSAFMHVKLFDALCWLGTNGNDYISSRGKDLLVDLMCVVNKVCTEKVCSDLLTLPSLIEYAANSANVKKRNDRAYKASDVLKSLSSAFSVSKRKEMSIYSATPAMSLKNGTLSTFAVKSKMSQVDVRRRTNSNISNLSHAVSGRTLNSISEELLQTSSGLLGSGTGRGSSKSALAYELKMFLSDASLDKSEFNKQMESSRVLGKEGKEPFRWDWAVIGDMLDYSFTHSPDRLADALKTKWVKRLSGFFRCAVEEKGYFANLEWEPGHLQYFDCACQCYKILTAQQAAFSFLNADRRGMLFTEIVRDLEAVIAHSVAPASASFAAAKNLNVFRLASCQQTMAREYFALVGRTSASPFARKLINASHLYDILVQTGSHAALDYLSRNVLTSLSFTDGGYISKDLMQIYLTSGSSSTNLRLYSHSLLRALLRSRSAEVCEWGIEVMVQQMMFLHVPRKLIVHCMEEAAQDRVYLGQLIRSEPDLAGADMVNLSIRFLALSEGFVYLSKLGWVEAELRRWRESECREYSARVEVGLAKALNSTYLRRQQSQLVRPIPLQVSAFSEHPSAPHGLRYPDGGVDLEGLLRLPLNIEAKVSAPLSSKTAASGKEAGRYLRLDSYLDTSELRCPASNEMTSDSLRTIKVRGIVLNAKGEPGGFPVLNDRNLMSCLLCGTCPVSKEGRVGLSVNNLGKHHGAAGAGADRDLGADGGVAAAASKSSNMSVQARRQSFLNANAGDKSFSMSDSDWCRDHADVPVSAINAAIHDWTTCAPTHRTAPRRLPVPGDPHRYSIEIPGEPTVFVFSTQPPVGSGEKASPAVAFLVEIHYILSLKTGQSAFLPLPRHLYGEMARTSEGRALLANRRIVSTLLQHVEEYQAGVSMYVPSCPSRQGDPSSSRASSPAPPSSSSSSGCSSPPPPTARIISSLWGLGHIAAIEEGFQSILDVCPRFVPTCIDLATDAMSYSVRSCAFSVLGLISRTESGSLQLAANQWEASPIHYVAVAMPDDPSVLFSCESDLDQDLEAVETRSGDGSSRHAPGSSSSSDDKDKGDRVPFSVAVLKSAILCAGQQGGEAAGGEALEAHLLQAIGRLPGQLLYKDTLASIQDMRRTHPEVFASRSLFLAVHRLLETYSFKLSIRRFLLDLFPASARKQAPHAVS